MNFCISFLCEKITAWRNSRIAIYYYYSLLHYVATHAQDRKNAHTHYNTLRHFSSPAVLWGGQLPQDKNNKVVQILAVTRPPSVAVHASSWRPVVLANTLGSWSRWASSLLTDRLQYRDAAKASGEIRARTISAATLHQAPEPSAAQTHHPIQFPGQIHDCAALTTHDKVSGDGTFSLMEVEGWFSGMAWQGQTSQDEFRTGSCPTQFRAWNGNFYTGVF